MSSKRVVLIVDDEIGPRMVLKVTLENDFTVETFADGLEALRFAESHEVHVAIVDHTMPIMNGDEVCRKLREIDPTISLIGFSGNERADFGGPLFGFIAKQAFGPEQVAEMVAHAADESAGSKAASSK